MRRSWLAAFRQIGWSTKVAGFGNMVSALSATVIAEGSALSWRQMGTHHLQVAEVDGRPGWSFVAAGTLGSFRVGPGEVQWTGSTRLPHTRRVHVGRLKQEAQRRAKILANPANDPNNAKV